MKLAFLDLASRKSGFCVGRGDALPLAGAWLWPSFDLAPDDPKNDSWDYGGMLDALYEDVCRLIDCHEPEMIGYEEPILVSGGRGRDRRPGEYGDKLVNLRKLYPLGPFVEWVCLRRGVRCVEVDLRSIKKELAGFGGADKNDMVAAAEKLGIVLPKTKAAGREDAADAAGGWLYLLRLYGEKTFSQEWDRRLWGRRPTLL